MLSPELSPEQHNVALKSPDHLIAWLKGTNRQFLVFVAEDLVRGQSWPNGIEALMQIIEGYRDVRATIDTGRTEGVTDAHGRTYQAPIYKGEQLEIEELDRAIRWLVAQMVERNPDWSLEQPAL